MSDGPMHNEGRDDKLNRLIRAASRGNRQDFERPSDEIISAYLLGKATADQRLLVLRALDTSADFRRELRDMAEDLAEWTRADTHDQIESHKPAAVPLSVTELTAQYRRAAPDRGHGPAKPRKEASTGIFSNVMVISRGWVKIAMASAAILAVAFIGWQMTRQRSEMEQWAMVTPQVESRNLLSMNLRSVAPPPATEPAGTAEEAAFRAYQHVLRFKGGAIVPDSGYGLPETGSLKQTAKVTLQRTDKSIVTSLVVPVPEVGSDGMGADETLWLVTLPNRQLLQIALDGRREVTVTWRDDFPAMGLLTITMRLADGTYVAGPAVVVGG